MPTFAKLIIEVLAGSYIQKEIHFINCTVKGDSEIALF
jgi:hypothetical protein